MKFTQIIATLFDEFINR